MKTKAILLMVFFLGWVTTGWAADHVKGDGKLTSKKISVADYNEIKVDGVIDFNYEQSDDPSTVEVTVDQNLHPYVNIEVILIAIRSVASSWVFYMELPEMPTSW